MRPRLHAPRRSLTLPLLALAALVGNACGDDSQEGTDLGTPAPIGSIRVSWSLALTTGAALSCEELSLSGVRIRVAGLEATGGGLLDGGAGDPPDTTVDCELGEKLYSNVTVGRYPVRVSLLRGTGTVQELAMNVDVVEGQTAEARFAFEFSPQVTEDRGNLRLRWTIDLRPAAEACDDFEATTVEIRTEPESIEQVSEDVSCTAGEVRLENLLAGTYRFRLRLVKADGASVTTNFVTATVVAGQDTDANIVNLAPSNPLRSRFVALWTVNSSTDTPAACADIDAGDMTLIMVAVTGQGSPDPISTSCGEGRLGHDSLLDEGLFDVQLRLVYDGGLSVTSTAFTGVRLQRGQTATVTADFLVD